MFNMNAVQNNPDIKSLCLSRFEVTELSGLKQPAAQIRWLRREGFQFRVAADGRPRVLRAAIVNALGGTEAQPRQLRRVGPDWSQFK